MTPLRAWRKRVGLSQVALAARLGVGNQAVNRWETGRREPPPYLWLALAAIQAGLPRVVEAPE